MLLRRKVDEGNMRPIAQLSLAPFDAALLDKNASIHGRTAGSLLVVHEAAPMRGLQEEYRRASSPISQCSRCRRVERIAAPSTWHWVPEYVAEPPRAISHGLCSPCRDDYHADNADAS